MSERCPRCETKRLKSWHELTDEEKTIIRLKPSNFSPEQRKKHRFCLRCGFEEVEREAKV